jgi:hypothetical protein
MPPTFYELQTRSTIASASSSFSSGAITTVDHRLAEHSKMKSSPTPQYALPRT